MSLDGLREVEMRLRREVARIEELAAEGVREVAFNLWERSVDLAPVDSGDLRGNAHADPEDASGLAWVVGFPEPYALIQHENMEFNHPRGGQAKYLQQPFEENVDNYIEHIRNKLRGGT